MDLWTIPLIVAIVAIGIISFIGTLRVMNAEKMRHSENDEPVSERTKQHPYTWNPIVWTYSISAVFIVFVVLFYWMKYSF